MTERAAKLEAMLSPRVVAHVGASESGLYPADVFRSLIASNVTVYPVNPNRATVFDRPCFASLADLPDRADLAVITVRRELVPQVLEECAGSAVPAAVVFAAGFAEADQPGRLLQEEIARFRDRILLLGPNCAGFANIPDRVVATRLYSSLRPGGVSLVSQSGALMMALHGSFTQVRAGMRFLVSVGNQIDLSVEELLEHFACDAGTRVCAAFLEGISSGERFVRALEENLRRGKPVVLLRSGRTSAGRRLAATHTGAVAGADRVFEAVCRQYGAVLVDDVSDLVQTARLFEAFGDRLTDRVAYLTQSGGLGSLTADLAKHSGLEPRSFSPETVRRLRDMDLAAEDRQPLNPLDLRGDAMRGRSLLRAATPFFEDPEIDAVVLLFAKNPNREVEQETAESVLTLERSHRKPLIVVWVGDFRDDDPRSQSAAELIERSGIPLFRQPGEAVRAIARVVGYYRYRNAYLAEAVHADVRPS